MSLTCAPCVVTTGAAPVTSTVFSRLPIAIEDLSAQGGQTDQPLDLGTIIMPMQPHLRVGRAAPPLEPEPDPAA